MAIPDDINEEINKISSAKDDIKDAINAKGGSVSDSDPLSVYAQRILESVVSFSDLSGEPSDNENLATALNAKEDVINKVTSISTESTDTEYPSAKCVFDAVNEKKVSDIQLSKVSDYLYTLHYNPDQMDYEKTIAYLYETYHPYNTAAEASAYINGTNSGACSAVRKGNFIGRNYDWYYSEAVSFVIKKEAQVGKYKSIGIAGGFDVLDKQAVESREYEEIYDMLPYMLVDGINEKGLVVTLNVVPVGEPDMVPTTGTHPTLEGDNISMLQLPSYLLDNFATATEAKNWIVNSAKIYGMYNENIQEEMHVLIADKDNTFIVEFVDNEAVVHSDKHAMTNFYLTDVTFDSSGNPIRSTVTPHGQGLERYEIINANYNNIDSSTSMREMMNMLTYTKSYDTDPIADWWMTEFVSDYASQELPYPDLTVTNSPQDFVDCGLVAAIENIFAHRTRDGHSTWQTVHSSVYDISKRQFTLIVQEGDIDTERTFQLFPNIADGKLIIKQNSVSLGEYTANQQGDTTIDIQCSWEEGTGEGAIVTKANASQGGQATGNYSVAEGFGSDAKGDYSHAEGQLTTTNGGCAHAEGQGTTAQGNGAHAEGIDTIAQNQSEHAEGQYNKSHKASTTYGNAGNTIHSVGIGTGAGSLEEQDRRNAIEIMQNGDVYLYGVGDYDGADIDEAKTLQEAINESGGSTSEILETITPLSDNTVSLQNSASIYSKTISANTTFTFDVSDLGDLTNKAITFELYLTMASVYTLTFPNSVTWIEEPDFSNTGKYLLVFKSLDEGTTWLGNLEVQW